jgi:hypothetical protein
MPHTQTLHQFQRRCEVFDSSNVNVISYDQKSQLLRVEFKSGTYDYQNISPRIFGSLCASISVGAAFAKLVKPYYQGMQV